MYICRICRKTFNDDKSRNGTARPRELCKRHRLTEKRRRASGWYWANREKVLARDKKRRENHKREGEAPKKTREVRAVRPVIAKVVVAAELYTPLLKATSVCEMSTEKSIKHFNKCMARIYGGRP